MNAVVLSCESLEVYVRAAQQAAGTDYPVVWLNRQYHDEPSVMRSHILETLAALPAQTDAVLVAMGFCGGSWDHIEAPLRMVIPRVDDCISLLLHTDDQFHPNLKQMGHMYMLDADPDKFSPERMFESLSERYDPEMAKCIFDMWFENYRFLDVIDTQLADCYSEAFVEQAQRSADLIGCDLDYTPGSNRLLEKLMRGQWDDQFIVVDPGRTVAHKDFFE